MRAAAAVSKAKQHSHMADEPTMVVYDDDYMTYRVITADDYNCCDIWQESDLVWTSDDGYIWTRRQIAKHPNLSPAEAQAAATTDTILSKWHAIIAQDQEKGHPG